VWRVAGTVVLETSLLVRPYSGPDRGALELPETATRSLKDPSPEPTGTFTRAWALLEEQQVPDLSLSS
jgi:hypothetical protein